MYQNYQDIEFLVFLKIVHDVVGKDWLSWASRN